MSATDTDARALPQLHTIEFGTEGPWVVFLHGLFGQGRNFALIAKELGLNGYRTVLVDLPNHGRSEWTQEFSYQQMAEAVAHWLRVSPHVNGEPVTLVGHSMGGKTAMLVALGHPELIERLAVLDISPVDYHEEHEVGSIGQAALDLDLAAISSRQEASERLQAGIPNRSIRDWMLTNLRQQDGRWHWLANLDLLVGDIDAIKGWPAGVDGAYQGPVLWIKGETSEYVLPRYEPTMRAYFPETQRVTIKGAGHWVHSQKREVVVAVLRRFLERTADGRG